MRKYILNFAPCIAEWEKQDGWQDCVDYLLNQLKLHPNNVNHLICAGTEIWYTILIMEEAIFDRDTPDDFVHIPIEQLREYLIAITDWGMLHFCDDAAFNAYFGYMIKVMPYFFRDYGNWDEAGIAMMKKSYALDPISPFTRAMYYEQEENWEKFSQTCAEIWQAITPQEWGKSLVQQYFFRILDGEKDTEDGWREPG